ncbi:hypothetical protein CPC197_1431 [Chlamydia psittaci C1/97]|nr:hypothetical protein CPC197_1431 [Chlamydia psittaci C1/97]
MFSFFTIALYGLPNNLCQFHKNSLSRASKYPFANSTRTALAINFLKGKM